MPFPHLSGLSMWLSHDYHVLSHDTHMQAWVVEQLRALWSPLLCLWSSWWVQWSSSLRCGGGGTWRRRLVPHRPDRGPWDWWAMCRRNGFCDFGDWKLLKMCIIPALKFLASNHFLPSSSSLSLSLSSTFPISPSSLSSFSFSSSSSFSSFSSSSSSFSFLLLLFLLLLLLFLLLYRENSVRWFWLTYGTERQKVNCKISTQVREDSILSFTENYWGWIVCFQMMWGCQFLLRSFHNTWRPCTPTATTSSQRSIRYACHWGTTWQSLDLIIHLPPPSFFLSFTPPPFLSSLPQIVSIKSPNLPHVQCSLPYNVNKNRYANINCCKYNRTQQFTHKVFSLAQAMCSTLRGAASATRYFP